MALGIGVCIYDDPNFEPHCHACSNMWCNRYVGRGV